MPTPPQDVIDLANRADMPNADVIVMWEEDPGFVEALIRGVRANIYSRLRKRYVTPMNPEPEIIVEWIARLATPRLYARRGVLPNDPTITAMREDRARVFDEIKEAADAREGLHDLPLLDANDETAITKGGPIGYSEPGPYEWTDRQREDLRGR